MAQIEQNGLITICDDIISMSNNGKFNYENSGAYNSFIAELLTNYNHFIAAYNREEENPERFFDSYSEEILDIFKKLLKESNEFLNINLSDSNDIALLEKYFGEIALTLANSSTNKNLPTQSNISTTDPMPLPFNNFSVISQQEQQLAFEKSRLHNQNIAIEREIYQSFQSTQNLLDSYNLLIWREQNNKLFYRLKPYMQKQKGTKAEISDMIFKITGIFVPIYASVDEVMEKNDYCLIISFLPMVRKDVFNPWDVNELTPIANNLHDRNTFEYTELLKKRLFSTYIKQLEFEVNNLNSQLKYIQPGYQQMFSLLINKEKEMEQLKASLFVEERSFIEKFLKLMFYNENEFNSVIAWISNFFWTLNKSNTAVVLIGDSETTDILVNCIIKPIFIKNKKYLSTITNGLLAKESDDGKLFEDKIFFHINNLSAKTDVKRVSKILRNIVKPNYVSAPQARDQDEPYVYGELLITSEKENPYPYLKKIFSSCTVLRVRSMDTILEKLNMEYSQFDKGIAEDLSNFVNRLMYHSQVNRSLGVLNTDEKSSLHTMKNGVLVTPAINRKIDDFIKNILSKNRVVFELIKERDIEMFKELLSNLNEDMIAQPLLSTYFNIVNGDMLIPDNNEFIKILQTKASMFSEIPNDKSKANGKKRYKIFRETVKHCV